MGRNNFRISFMLKDKSGLKKKVEKYRTNGNDEIILKIQGIAEEIKFDKEEHSLHLGGREISPWLSYAINAWNVTLPFITYKSDEAIVEEYLSTLRTAFYEEKDI
jgi:hypothetical protein